MFCSYCGQRLFFDDEVKRSEHVYRKIDEARLREAEARIKEAELVEKRETAKARSQTIKNIVAGILVVIFVAIPLFSCAALMKGVSNQNKIREEEAAKDEQIEKDVSSQMIPICKENQATITSISSYHDRISIYLTAADSSKETANKLQKDIVNNLSVEDGIEVNVEIDYPEHRRLRSFTIDKYGQVQISFDFANSISDDDIKTLKKEYEKALTPIINKYDAELESIEYKGDTVVLMIITSIREKAKIDLFIDDIVTVNNTLNSLPLNISFKTSSIHYTCKAEISSDDSIAIKDDRRNEMTDEEAEDIIQNFLPKLSKASKKHDAKIADITVENDTLNVDIAAEYQDKKRIEKLEQSVNSVFEKEKSIKAVIRITTDNEFDTTKEWSIDTNGVIDEMWDFTE